MALEAILEKPTVDRRREVLQKILHFPQPRDNVMDSRRQQSRKSASLRANTFSRRVDLGPIELNDAPETKQAEARHLGFVPCAGQVDIAERIEQVLHPEGRSGSGSSLSSQTPAHETNGRQCQGMTTLGERCKKLTLSEFCNLHSKSQSLSFIRYQTLQLPIPTARCKGITKQGTPCTRNGPKNGFCFRHVK
jgi:hypothetical protein